MNLHNIAFGVTKAINGVTLVNVMQNTGSTQNADFTRTPVYTTTNNVSADVQGLKEKELTHMASMNIQGILRSVHLNGDWRGIARASQTGGDKLVFGGFTWLVVWVYETWPNWSRVVVAQQTS